MKNTIKDLSIDETARIRFATIRYLEYLSTEGVIRILTEARVISDVFDVFVDGGRDAAKTILR